MADMECREVKRPEDDGLRVSGGRKKRRYAPTRAATRKRSGLVGDGASLILVDTRRLFDSARQRKRGCGQGASR